MGYDEKFLQINGVQPGPCPIDPQTGEPDCPPPNEIVCIKVEKVYESCRKVQVNEDVVDLSAIAVGNILSAACQEVELIVDEQHPFICEKIPGTNRARVSFYYQFRCEFVDQEGVKQFTSDPIFHQKVVIMSARIQEKDLYVQCEVFLECIDCFPSGPQQITCCIGKLLVFKLVALVQLMIPAYGFCPEPDPCPQVETECPPYDPIWPPFPPQNTPNG